MDAEVLHPTGGATSATKRKRAPWPHRPMSPIERLQAQADAEDEDLDNFRQHKRYITEVMANGLSCALSLSGPTSAAWPHGSGVDGCAAAMEADAGLAGWNQASGMLGWEQQAQQQLFTQQQQQQQQQPPQQQNPPQQMQTLGVLGGLPAALQWPPRRVQPVATPAVTLVPQPMDATSPHMMNSSVQQQPQPMPISACGGSGLKAAQPKPLAAAHHHERSDAAAGGAPSDGTASKVDLRKVTLLRSLLHRTEEHLRQQGGSSPAGAEQAGAATAAPGWSGGLLGAGWGQAFTEQQHMQPFRQLAATTGVASCWQQLAEAPLWTAPAAAGVSPAHPPAHFATARCATPLSSEGSMGAGGCGASPQSPASCEMATSSGNSGGERRHGGRQPCHEQEDSGDEAGDVGPPAATVARSAGSSTLCGAAARDTSCAQPQRQLSSWLLPFRQLSVQRPPPAPQQQQRLRQCDNHQQQQQQEQQEGPPSPEPISRERIERLRAKALQVAASHPDLEDGNCSPKSGRRVSMDETAPPATGAAAWQQQGHNCGEGWQIPAWRGAARAESAARRHSSHL